MSKKDYLKGKKLLIVDDEADVLETLEEFLPMCNVVKANSFNKAKGLLSTQYFDIVILDIMGVDGYGLLEIAKEKALIAVMLTAHALSIEDTVKSYKKGAASYIPKEEMADIETLLNDVLEAKEKGESFWWRWLYRLGPYYEKKFGPAWQDEDKKFWEKFRYYAGQE